MRMKTTLILLLGLAAAVSVLLGCGAAPAAQPIAEAPAPAAPQAAAPTAEPVSPESVSKASETKPSAAKMTPSMESETEAKAVEVGYKVGMRAPEFGMSLLDGTKVTSASLADEGKPTFIYFHATW